MESYRKGLVENWKVKFLETALQLIFRRKREKEAAEKLRNA